MKQVIQLEGREIRITGKRLRIASLEAEFYRFVSDPEPIISGLQSLPNRPDIFTFMQGAADPNPHYGYRMEWDNMAVIQVTTFDHWWDKQITSVPRNRMKQAARRGVVMREVPFSEELVRGIWKIYNETPIRQGRRFPHYGKDLETVYRDEATFLDSAIFIGAYLGDELIGFTKLVCDEERTQAGMMNILSMIRHRDTAPNNALVAEAVRACAARSIPNLFYWRFAHGKRDRDSVSDFKTKCGFKRLDVPRYYVPLTPWGQAALYLGFHHRLADRLPEPLMAKVREIRNRWNNRKNRTQNSIAQVSV